jgi:hypothetical protein
MRNCLAKPVFVILLLFVWGSVADGQENCDLTSRPAALLLNLKIGMSPEDAQNIFGKDLKIKVKKNGERTIFQNYIKTPAANSLKGIRAIFLRFYKKRLYQLEIFYEPRTDLETTEEISAALASQLNFPAAQWQIKNKRAEIRCSNLWLLADNVLNPRIQITDETVLAKIEESRKKK